MVLGRRRFLLMMGSLALSPLLPGCLSSKPLVIASHVWPGYELMFLARREGWLPQKGLTFLETASATESLAALSEERADGAALTLDEVLRARAGGVPLTVILVFDVSAGADMVLARPGIEKVADLRGRRIATEQSALGALMLYKVLETAGLSAKDVMVKTIPIDGHLAAWRERSIDAVITYDPIATKLQEMGARRIFDSRLLPATIFDVLAVRPEALKHHASTVRGLVAGHFRALEHLRTLPQDAAHRMAGRLKLPAADALNTFKGLELPDVIANHEYLSGSKPGIVSAAKTVSEVLLKAKLLENPSDLNDLVNADFLPKENI